jgi:transposase
MFRSKPNSTNEIGLRSPDFSDLKRSQNRVTEPTRVCRRLQLLRALSHDEQDEEQIFTRDHGLCGSDGPGSRQRAPSRWAAVTLIAAKIGCTPQALHDRVKKSKVDNGPRDGVPTDMAKKLKALERENRELLQANEILRKASA